MFFLNKPVSLKIIIIVAVAENGVIGDDSLLWHLGSDLRFFRRISMGHPVIMGRKTFESIGHPLSGRTNIIMSRKKDLKLEGCQVVGSMNQAIEIAGSLDDQCFIIGGSEIYNQAIDFADQVYLTEVHCSPVGKSTFSFDQSKWQKNFCEEQSADERNEFSFKRFLLEREAQV